MTFSDMGMKKLGRNTQINIRNTRSLIRTSQVCLQHLAVGRTHTHTHIHTHTHTHTHTHAHTHTHTSNKFHRYYSWWLELQYFKSVGK